MVMRIIVLVLGITVLCSCKGYSPGHAQATRVCQQHCLQAYKKCDEICHKNCEDCGTRSYRDAEARYAQYRRERCIQGGVIMRQLQSFRDPLQCRKSTCDCEADLLVCKKSCTGVIPKRLQVPSICC